MKQALRKGDHGVLRKAVYAPSGQKPCRGRGIDNVALFTMLEHAGHKGAHAIDNTPEVDALVWSFYPDWLEGLAQRFRLIQYDSRGEGLSARGLPANVTMDDFGLDIEAVVEHLKLERVFIWAWAARSHLAARYAIEHPECVSGLILNTCTVSNDVWKPVLFTMLPDENWEVFLAALAPQRFDAEERRRRVRDFQACTSREDWNAWVGPARSSNIEADLSLIRAPTLILHPRDFPNVSSEEGVRFAAQIPGARFRLIDGDYVYGDATQGLTAIDNFLADLPHPYVETRKRAAGVAISSRQKEVLSLIARGLTNRQIADVLVLSERTVERHVADVYGKIGAANRAQAAVYAKDHGIV